jgi:hypothetical protein
VTDLGERAVARRIGWQILRQRVETPSEY